MREHGNVDRSLEVGEQDWRIEARVVGPRIESRADAESRIVAALLAAGYVSVRTRVVSGVARKAEEGAK
jgi:hypothetical protein